MNITNKDTAETLLDSLTGGADAVPLYKVGNPVHMFNEARKTRPVAFAHGCNCFNTMGAGIATSVFYNLPELYEKDQKTPKGSRDKMGSLSVKWYLDGDPTHASPAFNLYTQFTHWEDTRFELAAYTKALTRAVSICERSFIPELLIPRIGCNLGRGNWSEVKAETERIQRMFPAVQIIFCVKSDFKG